MSGKFIVIEGMDGSGKTTQAKMLAKFLKKQGFSVALTHEPSNNAIGKMISNELVKDKNLSAHAISLAFAADRMIHLEKTIKPALDKYDYVVSDRYYHSSLAYQPLQGSPYEWVRQLNRYVLEPDMTFIIDVPVEIFLERRGETDVIFEKREFQEKLRNSYLELAENLSDPIAVVEGIRSIEDIHAEIREKVIKL